MEENPISYLRYFFQNLNNYVKIIHIKKSDQFYMNILGIKIK